MPFDVNRTAETSGFQSNCALNCLAHSIWNNLNYIENLTGNGILPHSSEPSINPIDDPQNGLLRHFRAYYGLTDAFTRADLISFLRTLNNPYHREIALGPVLRRMLPAVMQTRYREDWDLMMQRHMDPEERRHKNNLGTPGEYLSSTEVQYLAHYFGIKLEAYEGNDIVNNTLAGNSAGLQRRSGVSQNPRFFGFPVLNPPILKLRNQSGHWTYEEQMMNTAQVQARNIHYQNRQALDADALRRQLGSALSAASGTGNASHNMNIDLNSIFASSGSQASPFGNLFASLGNLGKSGNLGSGSSLAKVFFDSFSQTPVFGPLLSFLAGFVGGFIDVLNKAREFMEGMDIGRDLGDQDYLKHKDAGRFAAELRKLEPEDRREFNIRWRQNPGSQDCWDALAQRTGSHSSQKQTSGGHQQGAGSVPGASNGNSNGAANGNSNDDLNSRFQNMQSEYEAMESQRQRWEQLANRTGRPVPGMMNAFRNIPGEDEGPSIVEVEDTPRANSRTATAASIAPAA